MTSTNASVDGETSEDYTDYDVYQAGETLWKVFPMSFIILGTIGNSLSIFILCRKNIRKSTCSLYLIILACSDLVVLYAGLLRQWLNGTFQKDMRHFSNGFCKFHTWIVYLSLDFSAWILVAVTAERVALVWFPHSAKAKCTKRSATWILSSIFVFLAGINSHILYGMELQVSSQNGTETKTCGYADNDYKEFFDNTWPWIDFAIFCGLPFSCLLTGNILIITKVISSQRATKRQVAPHDFKQTHEAVPNSMPKSPVSSMSIMLFTLNTVFLLCTTPVSIYLIGYPYWYRGSSPYQKGVLSFGWVFVNLLMYLNNTFNFLLYCLSGTRFRNEVKAQFMKLIGRKTTLEQQQLRLRQDMTSRSNIPGTPRSRENGSPKVAKNGSSGTKSNYLSVEPPVVARARSLTSVNTLTNETSNI